MELQSLVKVKVRTLDKDAVPVELTVAAEDRVVSGEQVYNKACDALGLKKSSRPHFCLFDQKDHPTRRYRPTDDIPDSNLDLYLGKWCFTPQQEKDVIHTDQVAAHLVFLQAQHDVNLGKFDLSEEESHRLEECLEPGFTAEDQYIRLCQKQNDYNTLLIPNCKLLASLSSPNCMLKQGSVVCVRLSKFGVKLVAENNNTISFTWFEVSRWMINKEESTLTLTWDPADDGKILDVVLHTPQAELMLAGILEMITLLQKSDKSGASFHAEMVTVTADGSTVMENGLYNPQQAKTIQYNV